MTKAEGGFAPVGSVMENFQIEPDEDDEDDNFDFEEGLNLEASKAFYSRRKRLLFRFVVMAAVVVAGLMAYNALSEKSETSTDAMDSSFFGKENNDNTDTIQPAPDLEDIEVSPKEIESNETWYYDDYYYYDDDEYYYDDFYYGDDEGNKEPYFDGERDEDVFDGNAFLVLEEINRDPTSFTQGFTYSNGFLYESAGLYRQSNVRILDPFTGDVILKVDMDDKYFAEGMTYFGDDKLIQITWKEKTGFIYDAMTLDVLQEFNYTTTRDEGWGITYYEEEDQFIVSDGSNMLHFWDRKTLEETQRIEVKHPDGKEVRNLNELEFWNGLVLSNVWQTDRIYAIDPFTGVIVQDMDFSSIWPKSERSILKNDVLNGISVTNKEEELFITGKKWPKIYRVKMNMHLFH